MCHHPSVTYASPLCRDHERFLMPPFLTQSFYRFASMLQASHLFSPHKIPHCLTKLQIFFGLKTNICGIHSIEIGRICVFYSSNVETTIDNNFVVFSFNHKHLLIEISLRSYYWLKNKVYALIIHSV